MKIDFHSHVIPCEFLDAVAADPAGFSGVRVELKDGEPFLARDVIAIKLRTAERKSTRLNSSHSYI